MPDAAPVLLRLARVVVRRGERALVAPVDLALAAGEVVWLRGANGRGKTTLLRALAGLGATPDGTVERTAPLAFLGHGNALKDDLSAAEALGVVAALALGARPSRAALDAALAAVGLPPRHRAAPVRTLSQGQRRRVALARLALAGAPPLWLLDEPFDAIDADGSERVAALIGAHAAAGGAVLLTSHVPVAIGGAEPRSLALEPPHPPA